jgi:hypothetical protein
MRTYYYLKNASGEVDFINSNGACFAELLEGINTRVYNWGNKPPIRKDTTLEFVQAIMSGRELHAYICPKLSLETIEKYVACVNTSFPARIEAVDLQKEIKYWSLSECDYLKNLAKEINGYNPPVKYKFIINYSDYSSDNRFKFAIYLYRYLIESSGIVTRFCTENPPSGIDWFQWLRILSSISSITHNYFALSRTHLGYGPNKQLFIEPNLNVDEFFNARFDKLDFSTLAVHFRQPLIDRSDLRDLKGLSLYTQHTLIQKQHAK